MLVFLRGGCMYLIIKYQIIFNRLYFETEKHSNNDDSYRKDNDLLVVLYKFNTITLNKF